MPSWLHEIVKPGILIPIAAILWILWLTAKSAFKAFPFVSKFVSLVNTLVGTDEKPGLNDWQQAQSEKLNEQSEVLERVRHQVENDHSTNLRDEQDKLIASQKQLVESVSQLTEDFKDHVAISKAKDKEGDENAYRVAVLTDKVNKMLPVVEQLGQTWGTKHRNN